jgi:hypothetical protein
VDTHASADDNGNGTITYTYNLAQLFNPSPNPSWDDANFDDNNGNWILPDDQFNYTFHVKMAATPATPANFTASPVFFYKLHPGLSNESNEITANLASFPYTYSGPAANLIVPPSPQSIYTPEVTVSPIRVILENGGSTSYPVWLYVEGGDIDLSSLSVTPLNGAEQPTVDGRWISLGTLANPSTSEYSLQYKLNTLHTTGDAVKIYLVSGFGDVISTGGDISAIEARYRSIFKTFTTIPVTSTYLQGSITPQSGLQLIYNTPYYVDVNINSTSSYGSLFNPVAEITPPAGQILYKVEYRDATNSSWTEINSPVWSQNPGTKKISIQTENIFCPVFVLYGSQIAG